MPTRLLRICLVAAIGYLLLVSLALLARYEAHRWGALMAPWQLAALWRVVAGHVGAALLIAAALLACRKCHDVSPFWGRLALAAWPIMLLISCDRVVGVFYKPIPHSEGMLQTHATRLWTNRPAWVEQRADVFYRINHAGLRGPDLPFAKPAGERRVLFLGDSVTFGVGRNEEDCFVWQVESLAAGESQSDPDASTFDSTLEGWRRSLRVINCSVIGYSPFQEIDLLQEVGLRFDPDVLVQVLCLNDLGYRYNLVPYGGATWGLAPLEPSALEWSGLLRMARSQWAKWFGPSAVELKARDEAYLPERFMEQPDAPHIQEAWRVTLSNLGELVELAAAKEAPLVVVCFPHARQIGLSAHESGDRALVVGGHGGQPSGLGGERGDGASITGCEPEGDLGDPQRRLAAFCREHGVPFLDLIPTYCDYAVRRELGGFDLFPDGTHPTAEANRVAADAIYEFLREGGLVD